MTGERQGDWKAKFPDEAADLEWWAAAFGEGNIAGWTGRSRAIVKLSGSLREVDPAFREWVLEIRSLPAALDTVIEAVEGRGIEDTPMRHNYPMKDLVLTALRALRAEHSAGEGEGAP